MSVNRICKCGEQEAIRFNFGDDIAAEQEFHSQEFICLECEENEKWLKRLEDMKLSHLVETLEKAITKIKNNNNN